MAILSPKRQVTLPKELCDRLQVQPGDDLLFLEYKGRISIIKKRKGASAGALKHIKPDLRYSEAESLQSSLGRRRDRSKVRRRAA